MIPDRVVEVLRGPAFMHVGTRDAELHPAHAFAVGAIVSEDRQAVTFFVPEIASGRILRDLRDNGRVALAVGLVSHEAYQLKGTCASSRPADEQEVAFEEAHLAKLLTALRQLFPEEFATALIRAIPCRPSVAITFRVEEVFLQTPGPGAGNKLA
ncbi:MAG TPA: pyridoxamine 5'-phosphate oxidase family protein [Candidatus Binatia bacterium]|nr:pyridoxamine 5'-phosphate oxidase family protein [Candidatus Binatia bacterium]